MRGVGGCFIEGFTAAVVSPLQPCHGGMRCREFGVRGLPGRRWLVGLAALVCVVVLLLGQWRVPGLKTQPQAESTTIQRSAAPIDWGVSPPVASAVEPPALRVGAYITNISNIDLLDDQFSVEMLLWTEWGGDPENDPSNNLMILNGIYDGDIQRFERVSHERTATGSWNLYRVRSAVVKRWRLQRYPFDDQVLHIQIGLDDPLQTVNLDVVDQEALMVSPGLLLPGWSLKPVGAYASSVSLMSDLGRPLADGEVIRRQPAVSLDVPIQRRSLLFVAPDFLGYMLAVGLCFMSLLITHSRDDLILAAVVSAGGNFVFIAGKLPVTAMAGFIGNLQLIIFLGILYVVAADELIDQHLLNVNDRLSRVLRVLLLPSYVAMTLIGVFWIIP